MTGLIDCATLAARLDSADLVLVDCRHDLGDSEAGVRAHAEAHLPSARFAHLDRDLSDLRRVGHGRHPLPSAADASATLRRLGVSAGRPVVAYDAGSGAFAARLWWLLRALGHEEVAVLDGGFERWRAQGRALDAASPPCAPGDFVGDYRPSAVVDAADLAQGLRSGDLLLIDARDGARFRGEVEPLDAVAGHVPGARNRPFSDNLRDGIMRPQGELAAAFRALIGSFRPHQVVHMCGSGVTACHNLLAMEHAGLHGSRLYADSWSGWISDPTRPVATGG